MTDTWTNGRARNPLGAMPADEPSVQPDGPSSPDPQQRQALQVLTLAQRTAEEHVAIAQQQADMIRSEARAKAEEIVRDAQALAYDMRQDADKALSDARATAAQITRDAQTHADEARRNADTIVSEARARAQQTAADAQTHAEELKDQAQQRYDDVVGNLATKREALMQQIEALEHFDHDYRARLTAFMQAQLRTLWVDEPRVTAELEQSGPVTKIWSPPALQAVTGVTTDTPPAPQSGSAVTESRPAVHSGSAAAKSALGEQSGSMATAEKLPAQKSPSDHG